MVSYCRLCTTRSWKFPLALGITGMILGCLIFLYPVQSLRVLIYLIGAVALLIGVVLLFIAWTISRAGSPFALIPLLVGALVLVLGVSSYLYPDFVGAFIAVIIAALCIIAGLGGALTGAIQNGPVLRRAAISIGGIALAALGVAILLYPDLTTAAIMRILGAFIVIAGFVSLIGSILIWTGIRSCSSRVIEVRDEYRE